MNSAHLRAMLTIAACPWSALATDPSVLAAASLDFGELHPQPVGTLARDFSITPILQAGHPAPHPASGILPDSPNLRVDPNTTSSPFAGIGSLFAQPDPTVPFGALCTATPISRWTLVTAAHCLDLVNGDGLPDVLPENLRFVLNYGQAYSHIIPAASVWIHPDYEGSTTGGLSDDLAIIRLSEPLPEGVPIYPLADPDWLRVAPVLLAGYGASGDGVNGYYLDPQFDVKRVGANLLEYAEGDDEGGPQVEIIAWDFEYAGNPAAGDIFGIPFAFPNSVETNTGEGDSGGPIFMTNPNDPNDPTPYLAGVSTFTFILPGVPGHSVPGAFGSGGGGIWLNSDYQAWLQTIPESHPALAAVAVLALASFSTLRRFQSSSRPTDRTDPSTVPHR